MPVDAWSASDCERFFWALGQHLGRPGVQNNEGDLLGHVRDLRLGRDGDVRQYKTSDAIHFHCDAADAVGLMCLQPANEGGISRLVSSVSVFNRILAQRPDLTPALFAPTYFDTRGDGGTDAFRARVCASYGGRLRTFYHGEYLRSVRRDPRIRPLTASRAEVFDLDDAIADSPAFWLSTAFEPGAIQLISNHTVVHARTAYADHEDPARQRHLIRLRLSLESVDTISERVNRARNLMGIVAGLVGRRWVRGRHESKARAR